MRCQSCDYPLWNMRARQCPECGAPFAPSEYEFTPHSVAFCCPHCDQTYYGTDASGLLEPREFDCVSCGEHVHIDEMVLRPTEGLGEQHTRKGDMPWLDRRERGRVKAWFATLWMAMLYPARLMRGVPESSSVGAAWWYAILTNILLMVGRMLPALCFIPLFFVAQRGAGAGGGGAPALPGGMSMFTIVGGGTVLVTLGLVLFIFISIGLWGLICHGVLAMGGNLAGGLGRTFQALCYSSGANAITVVPCIGDFSFVWWIVSAVVMVREGQRVSGLRASVAVLAYPLLAILILGGFYAVLIGASIGGVQSARANAQSAMAATSETMTLGQRILAYAEARDGVLPEHALQLVPEDRGGTGIFIVMSAATSPDDVPADGGTLRDFQALGPNRQREAARRAAATLPGNVIAHRVGDFVFTWHGIDLAAADPGLWLVVSSPDPDANPDRDPNAPSVAFTVDGSTRVIRAGAMAVTLSDQNELRADYGLAPLPDPVAVTHGAPAVGR